MVVYLAGRYRRWAGLQVLAQLLAGHGHPCCSSWLANGPRSVPGDRTRWPEYAVRDLADIRACEVLVLWSEGGPTFGGGQHVELGYALALGKAVLVVGPAENPFHLLPEVRRVEAVVELVETLNEMERRKSHAASETVPRQGETPSPEVVPASGPGQQWPVLGEPAGERGAGHGGPRGAPAAGSDARDA